MQELSCPLLAMWPLTVQELVLRRKGDRLWARAPFVFLLGFPRC